MGEALQQTTQGQIVEGTRVLKNGVVAGPDGKFLSGPSNPPITRDNAAAMGRRRHELTRQKLAKSIADVSKEKGIIPTGGGSTDAIAAAGALLYKDIVLSDTAPARERRETWLAIGKHAGLLADQREKADNGDGVTLQIDSETAANLLQKLLENRQNG